jgi:glutamine synthetase
VRSVAPDANPYLVLYTLLKVGTRRPDAGDRRKPAAAAPASCRTTIYEAIRLFKGEQVLADLLGDLVHERFADLKQAQADRCPKALGSCVKPSEIQFHHEVTNQYLWSQF